MEMETETGTQVGCAIELDISDFHALEREHQAEGYMHGAPSPECAEDAECIARDTCAACGVALTFAPFKRRSGRNEWTGGQKWDYLAYAVCRACNAATAF